jgi:2-polyprenyl-3-methyl-5-hydroxy-6-metoxy-1,4-benzoquinol methylase
MFRHILKRISYLKGLDIKDEEELNESCVPAYIHTNYLAAAVTWLRLLYAKRVLKAYKKNGNILDFGAGSGELGYITRGEYFYSYIEHSSALSESINFGMPESRRMTLKDLRNESFDAILCLDSLEHNSNFADIIKNLIKSLNPNGILIVSGPTENFLYKIGRKISGFSGEYHQTNIYDIEKEVTKYLKLNRQSYCPFGIRLFSITCWSKLDING